MDKSFDFTALLRNNESKYKSKPAAIVSVAGGRQKRVASELKRRKSNRLSVFDSIRDIERLRSPPPKPEAQLKVEHRRQQLAKWKEEKEKTKKEAASNKLKPFLAGQSKYVPPPPKPSVSGRVTRSQSQACHSLKRETTKFTNKEQQNNAITNSFAPLDATFKAPKIKNMTKVPTLAQPKDTRNKKTNINITFEPVLPNVVASKPTRSKPVDIQSKVDSRRTRTASTRSEDSKSQTKNSIRTRATSSRSEVSRSQIQKQTVKTAKDNVAGRNQNITSKAVAYVKSTDIEPMNNKRSLRGAQPVNNRNVKSAIAKYTQTSSSSDMEPKAKRTVTTKTKAQQKKTASKVLVSISTSEQEQTSDSSVEKVNTMRRSLRKFGYSHTDSDDGSVPSSSTKTDLVDSIKMAVDSSNSNPQHSEVASSDIEFVTDKAGEYTPEDMSPVFKPVALHVRTPKAKMIPRSESSSEEKLRSPKSPNSSEVTAVFNISPKIHQEVLILTPEQVEKVMKTSPRVTVSRGKENARKEMKWKLDEGLMDEDTCEMESVTHFRKQLASEIDRMTAMCDQWHKIYEQTELPEPVQELVLSAVGQARLLMSQKLQQFASLIERCARPEPGTALVTPADLHGFWDMVFMQVENVDIRFKHLETLRARNWAEEKPQEQSKMAAKPRGVAKKMPKPAANSRLRDMIAAARKAKKDVPSPGKLAPPIPAEEEKHFDAGFFSVRSPVRCSAGARTPHTPQGAALYRAVLSSEAKKASQASASRNSASFAMLRASLMSKHVDCDGIAPLPQTPESAPHIFATPGRSILKSTNKTAAAESSRKSIKIVLFQHSTTDSDKNDSFNTENNTQDTLPEDTLAKDTLAKDSTEINKGNETSEIQHGKETEQQTDSGTSSMDAENSDEKITPQSSRRLTRQNAISLASAENSPENDENAEVVVKTPRRSTRKSRAKMETASEKKKPSGRKKKLELLTTEMLEKTPRKSKIKALEEIHSNVVKKTEAQRITRSRKSAPTASQ